MILPMRVFHRISSCSVIPKIADTDMLHQHLAIPPFSVLRQLQYLCELTQEKKAIVNAML